VVLAARATATVWERAGHRSERNLVAPLGLDCETRVVADLNVFMMCSRLVPSELSALPVGYLIRSSRPDELGLWKAFPFDTAAEAAANDSHMTAYFNDVYAGRESAFFESTKFVCDVDGTPIATGAIWPAYGQLTTVHWLKVRQSHEGLGIGRALLSELLRDIPSLKFPVYLHTQPGSFRAIKLYSDLGFQILDNDTGAWRNDYVEAIQQLRKLMPADVFARLEVTNAPDSFVELVRSHVKHEF
jgi:ribosomal protein S18 acetylase RimI-like enzyme